MRWGDVAAAGAIPEGEPVILGRRGLADCVLVCIAWVFAAWALLDGEAQREESAEVLRSRSDQTPAHEVVEAHEPSVEVSDLSDVTPLRAPDGPEEAMSWSGNSLVEEKAPTSRASSTPDVARVVVERWSDARPLPQAVVFVDDQVALAGKDGALLPADWSTRALRVSLDNREYPIAGVLSDTIVVDTGWLVEGRVLPAGIGALVEIVTEVDELELSVASDGTFRADGVHLDELSVISVSAPGHRGDGGWLAPRTPLERPRLTLEYVLEPVSILRGRTLDPLRRAAGGVSLEIEMHVVGGVWEQAHEPGCRSSPEGEFALTADGGAQLVRWGGHVPGDAVGSSATEVLLFGYSILPDAEYGDVLLEQGDVVLVLPNEHAWHVGTLIARTIDGRAVVPAANDLALGVSAFGDAQCHLGRMPRGEYELGIDGQVFAFSVDVALSSRGGRIVLR